MELKPSTEIPMSRTKARLRFFAAILIAGAIVALGPLRARADEKPGFAGGLGYDRLSRTISWDDGENISKLTANLVTLQGHCRFGERFGLSLKAGLSLPSFNGLVFRELPISIEYQAGAAEALALAGEIRGYLFRSSDFEIEAIGRIVSSIGFKKTWPLEGFAVDGETRGRQLWLEANIGGKATYTFFARFRPYLLIAGNLLRGKFEMDLTLEDLVGSETKAVKGKSALFTAFGASFEISPRFSVIAEVALLPYSGGVDSSLAFGISRVF